MELFGAGSGSKIPFETYLNKLDNPLKSRLLDMRSFVLSLGDNVIEDVRPHRVVYSKTMNFRIFLDVEPAADSLILSIKSGRSVPPSILTVKSQEDLETAKMQIAEAYQRIQ